MPLIGEALEGTANHARAGEIYEQALAQALRAGDAGSRDARGWGARTCGSWPIPR